MSTLAYTNYTNLDAHFDRGYAVGDRLVRGWSGEVDFSTGDTTWSLEHLFFVHNADDRPDGRLCPSMSIGDVVVLGESAFTVERWGFSPTVLDPADLITDVQWKDIVR